MDPAPVQAHETATQDSAYGSPGTASPLKIGGSVLIAILAGLLFWAAVRRFAPVSAAAPTRLLPPPEPASATRNRPQAQVPTLPGAVTRNVTPAISVRREELVHDVDDGVLDAGAVEAVATPPGPPRERVGIVERMRAALGRSRAVLQQRFDTLFGRPVDPSLFDELEEALLTADVGVSTADRIVGRLRDEVGRGQTDPGALRESLRAEMRAILTGFDTGLAPPETRPWVILVVGVNGSGKTTTIGKLAARLVGAGHRVLLAAADTYRAAAAEQLQIWAERAGADIVARDAGTDPGAVVYEALESARIGGHDVVVVDTAGRLQTRKPLMEQLSKIRRVIDKAHPGAPHETLLVLDGTMGQNGLSQARLFDEATPLTGVVVTKLDGTAKGGMILTIAAEMGLAVKLIGIGEGVEDLRDFDADAFVQVLA